MDVNNVKTNDVNGYKHMANIQRPKFEKPHFPIMKALRNKYNATHIDTT